MFQGRKAGRVTPTRTHSRAGSSDSGRSRVKGGLRERGESPSGGACRARPRNGGRGERSASCPWSVVCRRTGPAEPTAPEARTRSVDEQRALRVPQPIARVGRDPGEEASVSKHGYYYKY